MEYSRVTGRMKCIKRKCQISLALVLLVVLPIFQSTQISFGDAQITSATTVYDPTCGSGSLLLKVGDEAHQSKDVKVTLYGQEKDSSTAGLARMNMINRLQSS